MRKILVVLLVLSVLGGAFAQDGWSVSGTAEIGTILNLYDDGSDIAKIGAHAYNRYGWYGDVNGTMTINYRQGGLNAFIGLNTADFIGVGFRYDGERFVFNAETNLINMLGYWNDTDAELQNDRAVGSLWGYYQMLNEMIHMEIAFASRDTNFWNSDETAGEIFDFGWGYASVDGDNYFLTNLLFSGLEFGVMVPNVFSSFGNGATGTPIGAPNWGNPGGMTNEGYHPSMGAGEGGFSYVDLIEDAFKQIVVGMKFEMSPIEFAAQFSMSDYGAYLGAKWFAGPITFGLNFQGEFDTFTEAAVAASVAYNAGQFGASVGAGVYYADVGNIDPVIGVMPSFFYHVLPNNMSVSLDALFIFGNNDFFWAFTPQIFWNFKGTGLWGADYWAVDTGMIIRYNVEKDGFNALDVTFKWNF